MKVEKDLLNIIKGLDFNSYLNAIVNMYNDNSFAYNRISSVIFLQSNNDLMKRIISEKLPLECYNNEKGISQLRIINLPIKSNGK